MTDYPSSPISSHTPVSKREDFADKILDRIEEEKMVPRPRWQFWVKNAMFWALWVVSTVVAAVAASAIAFAWVNAGWEFREITHAGLIPFLLEMMPLVWLVALAVVLFAAHENIRHTSTGYRYPLVMILGLSLLVVVLLGVGLFLTGVGAHVEEAVGQHIPIHRPVLVRQQMYWTNPARGLLAGEVVSVDPNGGVFHLRTMDGNEWQIVAGGLTDPSRATLQQFPMVRVIGIPAATSTATPMIFHACAVFPWRVQGGPSTWNVFGRGQKTLVKQATLSRDILFIANTDPSEPCSQLHLPVSIQMIRQRIGE